MTDVKPTQPNIPLEPTPTPPKNWLGKELAIGAFVILAVAGIIGAYWYQTKSAPTPAPVQTDEIANWKMLSNDAGYGFTFKYPADLEVSCNDTDTFSSCSISKTENKVFTKYIGLEFRVIGPRETMSGPVTIPVEQEFREIEAEFDKVKTSSRPVSIGEISGVQYTLEQSDDVVKDYYMYKYGGGIAVLWRQGNRSFILFDRDIQDADKVFLGILSTFKFIDAENQTNVYNVIELGVQFNLPNSFSDLTHKAVKLNQYDQSPESVEFSSKRLEAVGCSLDKAPLGYLTYDNDKGGVAVAHARNSDLYYIKPNTQCGNSTLQDWGILQEALRSLVISND